MAAEKPETELSIREEDDGSAVVLDPNDTTPVDPALAEEHEGDERPSAEEATAAAAEEAAATSDAEREAIRERRRVERREKKERAQQRETDLRNELAHERRMRQELDSRLAAVERRGVNTDLASIDNGLRTLANGKLQLQSELADAFKNQDAQRAAQITDRMLNVRREEERLIGIKQNMAQATNASAPLDRDAQTKALSWAARNDWFKADGSTRESAIVKVLDQELTTEGANPRTDAYWQELDRRIAEVLPTRAKPAHNVADTSARGKPARTPVSGSGREGGGAQGSATGTYRLSAERVQALKDAGMWDDPQSRADMIRRYRETDRTESARAAR